MGCDIHFHVERRTLKGWERAEAMVPNPYADAEKYAEDPADDWYAPERRDKWYEGRNYNLFAVLADVRNGRGFAGCDTGDPLPVIHEPRGLPDDVSADLAKESEDFGRDGHSRSWASAGDLLAFDWQQPVTHRGWVSMTEFDRFKVVGKPNSWSGGISGGNVRHVTVQEMERRRQEILAEKDWPRRRELLKASRYFTSIEWSETIAEAVAGFMPVIVRMAHLALPDLSSVRAVYWFDN